MVEVSQGQTVIIGNTSTEVFLNGTKESIEAAVRENIATAAGEAGYILCSGCQVPDLAPVANINIYLAAGRDAGPAFGSPD